jgi:hypothetical protein
MLADQASQNPNFGGVITYRPDNHRRRRPSSRGSPPKPIPSRASFLRKEALKIAGAASRSAGRTSSVPGIAAA